jgi:hypothetical protein
LRRQLPELKDKEYEQLPRGRVIFDTNKNKAIIYLDKTLLKKRKVNEVLNFFDLDFTSAVLRTDPHYML